MAITIYSELQTAIANWTDRSNLTARIPEFIALAEARINRKLKKILKTKYLSEMETTATGALVAGTETLAFETDELAPSGLEIVSGVRIFLDVYSKELLAKKFPTISNGLPKGYAVRGRNLVLKPTPDSNYSYIKTYFQKLPSLSDTNTTNWLLTDYPDIYLYAALCEAAPFLKDKEDIQIFNAMFVAKMDDLESTDRYSGGSLRARAV